MTFSLLALLIGCREPLEPRPVDLRPRAPTAWGQLLAEVVDEAGDVDYDQLAANREPLDAYLRWIGRRGAIAGKTGPQQHAFWLNAFTALSLFQVIERDVQVSVNEIPSALPWEGSRFWYGTEFQVSGAPMSLWELGHERITHNMQDYRDFGALPVAARSGPPVRPELYGAPTLDGQLDDQMFDFLMSDRGLRFDADGQLLLNPVFERYDLEFHVYAYGVDLCTLAAYHTTGRRQSRLLELAEQGCPHDYFEFDWSLNRSRR